MNFSCSLTIRRKGTPSIVVFPIVPIKCPWYASGAILLVLHDPHLLIYGTTCQWSQSQQYMSIRMSDLVEALGTVHQYLAAAAAYTADTPFAVAVRVICIEACQCCLLRAAYSLAAPAFGCGRHPLANHLDRLQRHSHFLRLAPERSDKPGNMCQLMRLESILQKLT